MAADWIKMRTDLYRDPKVCVMADIIASPDGDLAEYVDQNCQRDMTVTRNVTRNAVVGALVSVWGVARQRGRRDGDDLFLPGCTLTVLDDIADLPGFGNAMSSVGWAEDTDEGVVLPGFFNEYNADPKPSKSPSADRQRRYRERKKAAEHANCDVTGDVTVSDNSDVTGDVTLRPREEKSREEKELFATASPPPDEEPAKKPRRPAKKQPASRPRNPLFDAVAEVAGMDGSTAAAGSLIGSVAASLAGADPPYTASDVHTFASRFYELCPHAAKDRRPRPTPKEIEKYIGGIRAKPAPKPQQATRPSVDYDPVPPMPTGKSAPLPWHLKPKAGDGEPTKEADVEPAEW